MRQRFLAGFAAVAVAVWAGQAPAQGAAQPMQPALEAAVADDWAQAQSLAHDVLTLDLVTWLRLRDGTGDFADYEALAAARPDWPDMDRVRARAEDNLPEGLAPDRVIAWFGDRVPATGAGAVALAQAMIAKGQGAAAQAMLRQVWLTKTLDADGHAAMVAAFGGALAPSHTARADALLWRWKRDAAERMLPLLDDGPRALVAARLAYARNTGDIQAKLDAVPAALRDDAGLAYDRFNWLADRGRREDAVAVALARSTSAEALVQPFRWSGWRRSLARWEMREGRPVQAYLLATQHHLTEGFAFADLEWLAGYLSLQYLDKPQQAFDHFQRAAGAANRPDMRARAAYWTARALAALNDTENAQAAYGQAATYQTGFYGLLAAEHLGLSLDPALTGRDDQTNWAGAPVMGQELVRAGNALLAAGARTAAVPFFLELGKTLPAQDIAPLGAYLVAQDEAFFAILVAKAALTRGVLVPSAYYPLHGLAQMDLPVEPALALSIARRESEFNAGIGSPVGALGLMQLMPATAEEVAGELGLPYSRGRLTGDWRYNARLGAQYLRSLQDQFGPSPVQIAAGYNAGPSRPEIWMDERGDPRLGVVDVIDWIEHIPFRETRNYVQHVTESMPIYRARLTGKAERVQMMRLLLGQKPLIRPVMRPGAVIIERAADVDVVSAVSETSSDAAPEQSLRPVVRPAR